MIGLFDQCVKISYRVGKRVLCVSSSYKSFSRGNAFVNKTYMGYETHLQQKDAVFQNGCFNIVSGTNLRTLCHSSARYQSKERGINTKDHDHQEKETLEDEREQSEMCNQMLHVSLSGHRVLVVQPYVKWGSSKKRNTTPELQLSEATSLIASLPKWSVEDEVLVPLRTLGKKAVFGSGNLELLKQRIKKCKQITAVFISIDLLQVHQIRELEIALRVPIYDRYMIVIQIFRMHAITKEAKLQVAMAEIPFLWSRLNYFPTGTADRQSGASSSIGGGGETFIEFRRRLLSEREIKLKKQLEEVRSQRKLLRNRRQRQDYPVVAVVGYTNAGKTSLIKALTGDTSLHPQDRLFATLDITNHGGLLPCQLKVLYVDTVGFMSDLPTSLIEAFVATLEDALLADVVVHVQDLSNPDAKAQAEHVNATLQHLSLSKSLFENIIVAGNKVDLVDSNITTVGDCIPVSARCGTGINELRVAIEEAVLRATGRQLLMIRVPMGGKEARWLFKEAAITNVGADPNNHQYMLMNVVISQAQLSKFHHTFIH